MKKISSLHELLIAKLQTLYDVEQQLVKALPKMARSATHPDLKQAFEDHLLETEEHVRRIEEALVSLGEEPKKLKSEAIRGLTADALWVMKNVEESALDAALVAAAQYVEHYEMA